MKNSLLADSPITWKITLFERCFIAIWGSEMFLELTVDCEFSFCLHVIKNNWGGWGGGRVIVTLSYISEQNVVQQRLEINKFIV